MLSKTWKTALFRSFSGGHDPYWLHLEQQHDKYPQYAHLHWHTVEPSEIGKYAKYRSAEMYGDHVSEDPKPVNFLPEVGDYKNLDHDSRNSLYFHYLLFEHEIIPFLNEATDPRLDGDNRMILGARDTILSILTAEQVNGAKELATKLIAEYKAAGVRVTREAIDDKVKVYLLKSLTSHQAHELKDGLFYYMDLFGWGLPMNED